MQSKQQKNTNNNAYPTATATETDVVFKLQELLLDMQRERLAQQHHFETHCATLTAGIKALSNIAKAFPILLDVQQSVLYAKCLGVAHL
jgi:hypothetical protein